MDLRVLHYFLTVAKEQSFTRAAAQLHITQPTLSRQLAALEGELGTVLFDRGGRTITLTDEGILLKRRALRRWLRYAGGIGKSILWFRLRYIRARRTLYRR